MTMQNTNLLVQCKHVLKQFGSVIKARPWLFVVMLVIDIAFLASLGPLHFNILPKAAQAQVEISQLLAERMQNVTTPEEAAALQESLTTDPVFVEAYREIVKWAGTFLGLLALLLVGSRTANWLLVHAALETKPKQLQWPRLVLRLVLLTLFWTGISFVFLFLYVQLMQLAYFSVSPVIRPFLIHAIGILGALAISYFAVTSYALAVHEKPLRNALVLSVRNAKTLVPIGLMSAALLAVLVLDAVWLARLTPWLLLLGLVLFGAGFVIARTAFAIAMKDTLKEVVV